MHTRFIIGTRGSPLALKQAQEVRSSLCQAQGVPIDQAEAFFPIKTYKTSGDKLQNTALSALGGKGLFTKEIDRALAEGEIDLAVHSLKDMPVICDLDFLTAAILPREDPRDAFISLQYPNFLSLPKGAKLGTASVRRQAQALAIRPDLEVVLLRGNVETRLRKIREGQVEASFLAFAGLKRLGLEEMATEILPFRQFLPASGQGAIAIQVRKKDEKAFQLTRLLNHQDTEFTVTAEKAFLGQLEGSCQTPIAAYARLVKEGILLTGEVLTPDGKNRFRKTVFLSSEHLKIEKDPVQALSSLGRALAVSVQSEAGFVSQKRDPESVQPDITGSALSKSRFSEAESLEQRTSKLALSGSQPLEVKLSKVIFSKVEVSGSEPLKTLTLEPEYRLKEVSGQTPAIFASSKSGFAGEKFLTAVPKTSRVCRKNKKTRFP